MKFRSTVHWPEKGIGANEVVEAGADGKPGEEEMRERVKQGFAVEHIEADPQAEPPGGAHVPTDAEKAAAEAEANGDEQ
jgi:hypothetical protein